MTTKTTNIAVVGFGRVARKHLAAIEQLGDDARLVAVCERSEPGRAASAALGVESYTHVEQMMERHPEIDLVLVLVPTGHHASVVKTIAPYGKHILTEKPMALRAEDCDEMIAACAASGSRLFVAYQNRYSPLVAAARRAVEAGELGRLFLATTRVRWSRDDGYYASDAWRGTWALDGGVISQQGSHHLDLLQWFLGPVQSVSCLTSTAILDIEVEDTAVSTLRGAGGALGAYEATVAARPENLEGSLSLLGDRGTIVIGGIALNELVTWSLPDAQPTVEIAGGADGLQQRGNLNALLLTDVIRTIRTGETSPWLVDGEEGRRNVELLTALYESSERHGAPVEPGEALLHCRLGSG